MWYITELDVQATRVRKIVPPHVEREKEGEEFHGFVKGSLVGQLGLKRLAYMARTWSVPEPGAKPRSAPYVSFLDATGTTGFLSLQNVLVLYNQGW